jgi:MFS family permease
MLLIFGAGFSSGLEASLLLRALPQAVQTQFTGWSEHCLTAAMLLISALVALPMGVLTTRIGVKLSMGLALAAIALCQGLFLWQPSDGFAIALLLLAGAALCRGETPAWGHCPHTLCSHLIWDCYSKVIKGCLKSGLKSGLKS